MEIFSCYLHWYLPASPAPFKGSQKHGVPDDLTEVQAKKISKAARGAQKA